MKLNFTKMHGLGNDFVVLDGVRQTVNLSPEQLRALGDRHLGIGCDQILLVEAATRPEADFRYRIFNADGGEVEQCGNGARCFVKFVHESGLSDKEILCVETARGLIYPRRRADGMVTVDMGEPRFAPEQIPFQADAEALLYPLALADEVLDICVVSMGNPHAVHVVNNTDQTPVGRWGSAIEVHPRFPQRVNAGFMQVLDRDAIRLRVYERGAGETLACGTGACAAVVAGIRLGLLNPSVRVHTRGGDLDVRWQGGSVQMTGPAVTVFQGIIEL